MAVNNTPIYVFVPGAWHTPDTFDGIRAILITRGYDSEAVALPSVGAAEPTKSGLHADIAHTNGVLRALAEHGRQIIVVAHSYGGIVGAGAVEGLGYAQRSKAGQPSGVIMVVWLAAFVTPKGKSVIDMLGGNWLPWMLLSDPDDGYCRSSQQETVFYHDITPEAQATAIPKLKPHAKPSFLEPATFEPWHEMPSMYLFCDKDAALPLSIQEGFAQTLGNPVTFHVDASHSGFLSKPEETADGLELALKAGREQNGIY
ncbi:alpha/beta-hydrolase [Penicillium canescens]|uniref:Alpha/beta-hydrolase n=1 Tax=Penicillium canescens TaxID=5083 RepID=A0AAD6IAS5_PENCN|nr:alpha/beta-hydrolase [Penicillium canescens]KAJ6038728.1 alpha/beta-hydrolase [Penicillium canescens]KAJ6045672.1 alpha/beta-hydrolase [Penicillium canescens]KAJ6090883.1 alpha/beta-hydrolase [Penicillium canescens]KAJ6175095.1 alpha/beta-hydrolase [Penicillium canescens]